MSSSYLFIPATSSYFLSRSCAAAARSSWHNLYGSVQLQTLSLIVRPLRLCVFVVHSYDRPLAGASPVSSFYIDVWGGIMILAMIWWPKPAVELVKMCLWLQRKVEKARTFLTAAHHFFRLKWQLSYLAKLVVFSNITKDMEVQNQHCSCTVVGQVQKQYGRM